MRTRFTVLDMVVGVVVGVVLGMTVMALAVHEVRSVSQALWSGAQDHAAMEVVE